jgi:hypothetical protein
LSPPGEGFRRTRIPGLSRYPQRKSASGRLLLRLVESNATRRARSAASERAATGEDGRVAEERKIPTILGVSQQGIPYLEELRLLQDPLAKPPELLLDRRKGRSAHAVPCKLISLAVRTDGLNMVQAKDGFPAAGNRKIIKHIL